MSYPYKTSTEKSMKKFYDSLSEKDKRRYAAIESKKLPHGGVNYISGLLECDAKTIRRRQKELTELKQDTTGIRQSGGGRKYAADFKKVIPIVFDVHLPKWNYRAIPQE
jgi:hypothetical protein